MALPVPNPITIFRSLTSTGQAAIAEGNAVVRAGEWLSTPQNWIRILYVAGGAFIVLTGIAMLASESQTLQSAAASTAKATAAAAKIGALAA